MATSIFILLPESEPTNQWMRQLSITELNEYHIIFLRWIETLKSYIDIENYVGYYDSKNVSNYLSPYLELEDCYPYPIEREIRICFQLFYDWRYKSQHLDTSSYTIFGQQIYNHTFCEIAQRLLANKSDKILLVHQKSHSINNAIVVKVNTKEVLFDNLSEIKDILEWFGTNRQPKRNFQIIPKHGENRQEIKTWKNREDASPLKCSEERALELLQTAIGKCVDRLYNIDGENGYVVFYYENETPQNMYHGHHIEEEYSKDPNLAEIIKKIIEINQ